MRLLQIADEGGQRDILAAIIPTCNIVCDRQESVLIYIVKTTDLSYSLVTESQRDSEPAHNQNELAVIPDQVRSSILSSG